MESTRVGNMNPTITNLAKHLSKTTSSLYAMKKAQPKQFDLIWSGWLQFCLDSHNGEIK